MVNVGVIGTGGIAAAIHLPGLRFCPNARVAALCDINPEVLARRAAEFGVDRTFADFRGLCACDDVHAVIVSTPNDVHREIALAAIAAGKHVLVEKPLALSHAGAREMWHAARAAGVRHQTAFNYRFIPAMRYLKHLIASGAIGQPYHLRAQRFQDWGDRAMRWRQQRRVAGTGELGDMASHRIDYAHFLLGPIARVSGLARQFVTERVDHATGETYPADVDDWAAFLGEFACGATCIIESTKLAAGHGTGVKSRDLVEINGSEGSLLYELADPFVLQSARRLGRYETIPVPREWLTVPGTARDPYDGEPGIASRWDQEFEFVAAITEGRECSPSLRDGVRAQAVMEAVLQSGEERRWVDVPAE